MTGTDERGTERGTTPELQENANVLFLAYCQIIHRPPPNETDCAEIIDKLLAGCLSGDRDRNKVISSVIEALARLPIV